MGERIRQRKTKSGCGEETAEEYGKYSKYGASGERQGISGSLMSSQYS
jgi:hypothetical protein